MLPEPWLDTCFAHVNSSSVSSFLLSDVSKFEFYLCRLNTAVLNNSADCF